MSIGSAGRVHRIALSGITWRRVERSLAPAVGESDRDDKNAQQENANGHGAAAARGRSVPIRGGLVANEDRPLGASSSLNRVVTRKAVPICGCVSRGPGPASVGDAAGILIS